MVLVQDVHLCGRLFARRQEPFYHKTALPSIRHLKMKLINKILMGNFSSFNSHILSFATPKAAQILLVESHKYIKRFSSVY